jgi:hypothetical protein
VCLSTDLPRSVESIITVDRIAIQIKPMAVVKVQFDNYPEFITELHRATTFGPAPDSNIIRVGLQTVFTETTISELFVSASFVTPNPSGAQIVELMFSCGKRHVNNDSAPSYKKAEGIVEKLHKDITECGCVVRGGTLKYDPEKSS